MRLFVAVELDPRVRSAAHEVTLALQMRLQNKLRARWVSTDDMHLTVRFIGNVAEGRAPTVIDALRPPLPLAPFEVALGHCGVFPAHGPPRVIWIGLEEGLASLKAMHDELDRRLQSLSFEPEDRPYSAHLTLARMKEAPRGSGATARDAIRAVRVAPARCLIDHAILFESRLSPRGSTYTPLMKIPLA